MEREIKFLIDMDGRVNFYHKTFYTLKFMDHMNLSVLKANKKIKVFIGKRHFISEESGYRFVLNSL